MPLVKIEYIRSFSSEDKVHVANNLLGNNISLKWKCATPGEKQATVCFQLEKASVITGIDIGNEHSAFIEVLVSRSAGMNDKYKSLLGMTSLMSVIESQQSTNTNGVKMFKKDNFLKPECYEKWDRIKLVCSQPFNSYVKFGLAFVKFYSESMGEENILVNETKPKFTPKRELLFPLRNSPLLNSREKRKEEENNKPLTAAAAIRAATSSLLNDPSSYVRSPRLLFNHLKESASKKKSLETSLEVTPKPRNGKELFYTEDDDKINPRIDRFIKRQEAEKLKLENDAKNSPSLKTKNKVVEKVKTVTEKRSKPTTPKNNSPKAETLKRKLEDVDERCSKKTKPGKVLKPFDKLLEDVVIVISGIQNPDRAMLRDKVLEMGAKYKGDWDRSCTHLVCAFMNTPKFNQVKGVGKIVTRRWVEECFSERKKLPWRRHALDKQEKDKDESEDEIWEKVRSETSEAESDSQQIVSDDIREESSDTEDIIEQSKKAIPQYAEVEEDDALFKKKEIISPDSSLEELADTPIKKRINPIESTPHCSKDIVIDVEALPETDNVTTEKCIKKEIVSNKKNKPFDFFKKKSFFVDSNFEEDVEDMLKNYIFIHEGSLNDDPIDNIDYIICGKKEAENLCLINTRAICILPDWIVDCHKCRQFIPPDEYIIM